MAIRKDKIKFFEKHLMDYFQKVGREHLPWRRKKISAYAVWVAEIMLQQTQVGRVIGYYRKFLERFPTVRDLAQASWEEFLPYYAGLGYYTRGKNMLRAARIVVEEHNGVFPRDKRLLEKLPGIGPYTAAAIMSFAYGDNHLAWDTNLKRVIGRFFFGGKHLITDETVWEDMFMTPKKILNAALMDFGSALCVARPKCNACPLRSRCIYYKEKGAQEIKNKKSQPKTGPPRAEKIDWSGAQAYVFLHENHKEYYSSAKKFYKPFILPANYNTRAGIKEYFQEKYHLTLSVRPPHKKIFAKGVPTLFINAQILLGQPTFSLFPKTELKEYNEIYNSLLEA